MILLSAPIIIYWSFRGKVITVETMSLREHLNEVAPFKFLGAPAKDELAGLWQSNFLEAGRELHLSEDPESRVWFLESGELILGESRVRPFVLFGERHALLQIPPPHRVRAVTHCHLWGLPGRILLEWIQREPVLARELGRMLREDQGIFHPLETFIAEVKRGLLAGNISIRRLIRLYLALQPALHARAESPEIDTGAFSYVVRRLPPNTTSTPAWYLTDELPPALRKANQIFENMESQARRRGTWQMFPGKNLVIIRNGITDVLDLVSCLCAFSIEARKIRRRLSNPGALSLLQKSLKDDLNRNTLTLLQELGFDQKEAATFLQLWGEGVCRRLWELILLHEDIFLATQKQTDIYHGRRTEQWITQILRGAESLLRAKRDDWPEDLEVHLISSNTHSVTNCLSPAVRNLREEVNDWARDTNHPYLRTEWKVPEDQFYALLGDYLKRQPQTRSRHDSEAELGILRLNDNTATGIQAQIIDLSRLWDHDWDPLLTKPQQRRPILIINIDYAFGEQAQEILRGFIPGFHRFFRGFHVIGKAGSLVGERGDILVPTSFLNQRDDRLFPLPKPYPFPEELWGRKVHKGVLLTVEGTLMQNRPMLQFYQNVHQVIGLEMEGYYFSREIEQNCEAGVLPRGVKQNYLYYVSDLPLEAQSNLAKPMEGHEGIPPLYALTRWVLDNILR